MFKTAEELFQELKGFSKKDRKRMEIIVVDMETEKIWFGLGTLEHGDTFEIQLGEDN